MTNAPSSGSGLTGLGKIISALLIVGLIALGGWIVMKRGNNNAGGNGANGNGTGANSSQPAVVNNSNTGGKSAAPAKFDTSELDETLYKQKRLDPAGTYVPQNNVIDIELSQYAGYAGLIAANGGLAPSDTSYFATKYGFKVRIKLSEEESWSALNAGKMAASATTADVLAAYGRQFQVVVPAQIGYSRGADGILVRSDIRKLNDLKGKTVSCCQFTESDFLLRDLAREANLPIKMLPDLNAAPDPASINVVYTKEGLGAGELFKKALDAGSDALAGCVTWAPATIDIPANSNGKARLLVSNKNLLLVADILIVNKGFADAHPDMVAGLVDGLLKGNDSVRTNPDANADLVGKALGWDHARTLAELQKVHLSNLPEQQAFFSAGINQGGSFASIFQSAVDVYSSDFKELLDSPVDADHFFIKEPLAKADATGTYKTQIAAIKPLASTTGVTEVDPVLSKDIRFQFQPNSHDLDMANQDNLKNLDAIKKILDISPGSRIMLVGHVDPLGIPKIRQEGGDEAVRQAALSAKQLSKDRASEILAQLTRRFTALDPKRFETVGMGWDKPISTTDGNQNRRVEVQWFTLE